MAPSSRRRPAGQGDGNPVERPFASTDDHPADDLAVRMLIMLSEWKIHHNLGHLSDELVLRRALSVIKNLQRLSELGGDLHLNDPSTFRKGR
ncbi:hypothetical protein [Streptomyces sp. S.PB5]|uniref:hypothetical protein n=1 Tax=Streptomyces sp. S.PB5 TaxID=3020844 RepID=UPI0025AFC108|nr:hypothetical protein [Streptomyces sp. S.PB5]MDN3027158.1 hypothetical protein [Streptomyces sp. S.PB5]